VFKLLIFTLFIFTLFGLNKHNLTCKKLKKLLLFYDAPIFQPRSRICVRHISVYNTYRVQYFRILYRYLSKKYIIYKVVVHYKKSLNND